MNTVTVPAVYLTYSPSDAAAAKLLKKEFADQGVHVQFLKPSAKQNAPNRTRDAISQSEAVIVLATSASIDSTNLAFEVGAAQAWEKPIYVITKDLAVSSLPDYLKEFRVFPVKSINKLIAKICPEHPNH